MSDTPNPVTLYVNRKARQIPSTAWQAVTPKPVDQAVQIMQAFTVADGKNHEQHGAAGDYILALADGQHVVVPAELFSLLFDEIGGSA